MSSKRNRLNRPEFLRRRHVAGIDLLAQFRRVGAEDHAVAKMLDEMVEAEIARCTPEPDFYDDYADRHDSANQL